MSWRYFFRRGRRDVELTKDIQFYLDAEMEDNIARGMPSDMVREHAHRKLGNTTLIREDVYQMYSLQFFETVGRDLQYAMRTMSLFETLWFKGRSTVQWKSRCALPQNRAVVNRKASKRSTPISEM